MSILSLPSQQVPLKITGDWTHSKLTGDSLAASRATMSAWLTAQAAKRETAASKNDLESYIISTREALETDEKLIKVRGGVPGGTYGMGGGGSSRVERHARTPARARVVTRECGRLLRADADGDDPKSRRPRGRSSP